MVLLAWGRIYLWIFVQDIEYFLFNCRQVVGKKIKLDEPSANGNQESETTASTAENVDMKAKQSESNAAESGKSTAEDVDMITKESESNPADTGKSTDSNAAESGKSTDGDVDMEAKKSDSTAADTGKASDEWGHETLSPASIALAAVFFFVVLRILTWEHSTGDVKHNILISTQLHFLLNNFILF